MKGTIKSREDIERLFRNGRRSSSSYITVLMSENAREPHGRNAFIAGKKLGRAPFRSRCKRVMRQIVLELGGPWNGYDLVFIAKGRIAFEKHQRVLDTTRKQLMKLGIIS